MKKCISIILVCILLMLAGCKPSSPAGTPGQTPAPSTDPSQTASPAQGSTAPTEQEAKNTRFFFQYDEQYSDSFKGEGVDVTKCESGNYYSCDRETGEIIRLYDGDAIAHYAEANRNNNSNQFTGDYIYYITKAEPAKIFRMDYVGNVKDELVHESTDGKAYNGILMASMGNGHEVVAVMEGKQIVIVDALEKTAKAVCEDANMDSLCDFYYEKDKQNLIVVFNTFLPNEPEGQQDGRQYYNVTTGQMADSYIW